MPMYLFSSIEKENATPAVQTCMTALKNELKKMERDEKLRLKFDKENATKTATLNDDPIDDDVVCVDINNISKMMDTSKPLIDEDDDVQLNEWQDVQQNSPTNIPPPSSHTSNALGTTLAQISISDMTLANITISTPIAALALALHSSLRSTILGFKCIGVVPEGEYCFKSDSLNGKKKSHGFAPPVRELPKNKFLPDNWDSSASSSSSTMNENNVIRLRYRKDGIGATILRISQSLDSMTNTVMAEINFGPAGGEPWIANIPMNRHINVDGLNAALEKCNRVKPALHYKALPVLLSEFCQNADLGIVKDDVDHGSSSGGDTKIDKVAKNRVNDEYKESYKCHMEVNVLNGYNPGERRHPPTIENDLVGVGGYHNHHVSPPRVGGDFAGDLLPSGIPAPGFANPMNGMSGGVGGNGNLMGMNHPYFAEGDNDPLRVGGGNFPRIGGLGMQPRHDPYYPPGVGIGHPGRGRGGRGGRGGRRGRADFSGDPNPDHQRPPNTFGSNMFM